MSSALEYDAVVRRICPGALCQYESHCVLKAERVEVEERLIGTISSNVCESVCGLHSFNIVRGCARAVRGPTLPTSKCRQKYIIPQLPCIMAWTVKRVCLDTDEDHLVV